MAVGPGLGAGGMENGGAAAEGETPIREAVWIEEPHPLPDELALRGNPGILAASNRLCARSSVG